MTGSGKTGLGLGIVEEALLSGIPCLVIDPKGDMGNLALTFPEFRPADFEPWMDEAAEAGYRIPLVDLGSAGFWSGIEAEIKDHLVAHRPVRMFRNTPLKIYSRIGETEEDFVERCQEAAHQAADAAVAKLRDRHETRIDRVKDQIQTAQTRMITAEQGGVGPAAERADLGSRRPLGNPPRGTCPIQPAGSAASRRAATQKARARAEAETSKLTAKQRQLADLEDELAEETASIVDAHQEMARQVEEVEIPLEKTDISIDELKLVWVAVG